MRLTSRLNIEDAKGLGDKTFKMISWFDERVSKKCISVKGGNGILESIIQRMQRPIDLLLGTQFTSLELNKRTTVLLKEFGQDQEDPPFNLQQAKLTGS